MAESDNSIDSRFTQDSDFNDTGIQSSSLSSAIVRELLLVELSKVLLSEPA